MKLIKTLAAGSIAAALVGSASAATYVVNVCGSTAYRSAVTMAEYSYLAGLPGAVSTSGLAVVDAAYTDGSKGFNPSGVSKSGKSLLHTISGGNDYYFNNSWTGSAAGAVDVASNNTIQYIPTTATVSDITGAGGNNQGTQFTGTTVAANPNVAMTDVQVSDISASIASCGSFGGASGASYAATVNAASWVNAGVTAGPKATVGTCNFEWVLGKGATPFSGLSQQNAAALIKNGYLRLSTITGNVADDNAYVFFIGRNEDSGTRIEYIAEATGGGTAAGCNLTFGSSVFQYMVSQSTKGYLASNTASTAIDTGINGFKIWPKNWAVNTISKLNWNTFGHSGYTGGGDVANMLSTPNTGDTTGWTVANAPSDFVVGTTKAYFVSSLGASDAATAVSNGATALAYGNSGAAVDFTQGNLQNGKYSLWTYEHCYYLTGSAGNALSGVPQTMADGLADTIYGFSTATLWPTGLKFTDLLCSRGATAGVFIQ